jgi:hypothetical protein
MAAASWVVLSDAAIETTRGASITAQIAMQIAPMR